MNKKEMTAKLRIKAMFIDHIVNTFAIMFLVMPFALNGLGEDITDISTTTPFSSDWVFYIMVFGMSLYLNKDMIQGKSIGKRSLKLQVIDSKTGIAATPLKCLVRNLSIAVWPIEIVAVMINPSRRIGDYLAGTKVEFISAHKNSQTKIEIKKIVISIVLGFLIILSGSFLFKGNIGKGVFGPPDYIETSYNRELSSLIESHLDSTRNDYLTASYIKVYDTITNDSVKYIYAAFYLTEDFIDRDYFDDIQQEIFSSMFDIVPKSDFILKGKFIYDGKSSKKATWKTYDWRKIDK